jgi:hypothetical protein
VNTNSALGGGMIANWNTVFFGLSFTPSGKEISQLSKIVANTILSSIEALYIQRINIQNHISWEIIGQVDAQEPSWARMSSYTEEYIVFVKSREGILDIAIRLHSQLGKPEGVESVGIRID